MAFILCTRAKNCSCHHWGWESSSHRGHPPTQVQIVENDDVLLHEISHGCVTGDSSYVRWPLDHQPRMRSKLQQFLHDTRLHVFLVSSVEQQPGPFEQLTFLDSTELSDCCDETSTHAGTKRMEFSIQSIFLALLNNSNGKLHGHSVPRGKQLLIGHTLCIIFSFPCHLTSLEQCSYGLN